MLAEITLPELPEKRLPAEPEIQSPADLQLALDELSCLDAREQTVDSVCRQKTQQINSEYAALQVVQVKGKDVPIADRRTALSAAVAVYATAERKSLLEGKAKSREFNGGHKLGWRTKPGGVKYRSGMTAATATELVLKSLPTLAKAVATLLAGLTLWGRGKSARKAAQVLDLKPALNLQRIKDQHAKGELTDDDLKQLGLQNAKPVEEFFVTPAAWSAVSQPST